MIRKNILKLFLFVIADLTSISLVASCESGETTLESEDDDVFTMESGFRYDENYHWNVDSKGKIKNKSKHKFDSETHLCKTCGVSNGGDDFQWDLKGDGTAVITRYMGIYTDLVISSVTTIFGNTYMVSEISSLAFRDNDGLESICLGSSVGTIGDNAFQSCDNLKFVTIGAVAIDFGYAPFSVCPHFATINYANGTLEEWLRLSIPTNLFDETNHVEFYIGWELVTDIIIPNTFQSISAYSFYGFDSITSVTIPKRVTSIGTNAFYLCSNLKNVYYEGTIEDWVKIEFGEYYYSGGRNPESYYLYAEYSNPCVNGANLYINGELLTEVILDNSYNGTIPDGVFSGVNSLETIRISSSIENLGRNSFYEVTADNVYYEGTLENWISLFSSDGWFGWYVDNFYIEDELFEGDFSNLSNNTTFIGDDAFSGIKSIKNIIIPSFITDIGTGCFQNCTNLESVVFRQGSSIKEISWGCYYMCSSLKSIVIPASVKSIDRFAFSYDYNLGSIYYCGSLLNDFNKITINDEYDGYDLQAADVSGSTKSIIGNATPYAYSESEPTEEGNYWHWVEEMPTIW